MIDPSAFGEGPGVEAGSLGAREGREEGRTGGRQEGKSGGRGTRGLVGLLSSAQSPDP